MKPKRNILLKTPLNSLPLFPLLILSTLIPGLAFAGKTEKSKINLFIEAVIAGNYDPFFIRWSNQLTTSSINIEKTVKIRFPTGIAYGAIASKILPRACSSVRSALHEPDGLLGVIAKVETLRNLKKISGSASNFLLDLTIKVPVLSDFKTQARVRLYQDSKQREVLEWKQVGQLGHLAYNRGFMIMESQGQTCKALVLGIHVIKDEHKIPWFGRATATSFTKTHYANYIKALESIALK